MGDESKPETGNGAEKAKEGKETSSGFSVEGLLEAIDKRLDQRLSGYTQKINGEVASLRRAVKGRAPSDDEGGEGEGEGSGDRRGQDREKERRPERRERQGLSAEEVDERMSQALEIGELRGRLTDDERETLTEVLEGASRQEQIRILRGALALRKPAEKADKNRGRDAPRTGRASPPATRDDEPARPRTKKEYLAMKPEARAKLDDLTDFDPDDLPMR